MHTMETGFNCTKSVPRFYQYVVFYPRTIDNYIHLLYVIVERLVRETQLMKQKHKVSQF